MIDIHQHVTTDIDAQLRRAREAGADRIVLLSSSVHPEGARTLDDVRAQSAALTRLVAGGAVSRDAAEAAQNELLAALAAAPGAVAMQKISLSDSYETILVTADAAVRAPRFVGLGELTPPVGGGASIEPVVRASAETAVGAPMPVLAHGIAPNSADDLRDYAAIARRHPTVPIVIGAFGGLNNMLAIELALAHSNIHLDLSSALQVFLVGVALREVPERCLFGSNTPYGDVVAARTTVEAASRDARVLELALHENAARLLSLGSGSR